MVYETGVMFDSEIGKSASFSEFLDKEIGTLYETNNSQFIFNGKWRNGCFIIVFGVNKEEIEKIRSFENGIGTLDYCKYVDSMSDENITNVK